MRCGYPVPCEDTLHVYGLALRRVTREEDEAGGF